MRSTTKLFLLAASAIALLALPAAAATLRSTTSTVITATYKGTNDLGSPSFDLARQDPMILDTGTGTNQANAIFSDTRTLSASATENLDLAGVLVDPLGGTLTFTAVKVLKVCAAAANTNNVVVGGAGANTWVGPFADATDKVTVKPGGCALFAHPGAGYPVTAATGDILLVANSSSGTSVTYDVIIIGVQ